jgi:ATP-binding protein involved in chromosome partitioning
MPPGIGDEVLDVLSFLPQASFLVVSTPSKVAIGAVEKLLSILVEEGTPLLGVVENMKREGDVIHHFSGSVPVLGNLRYDTEVETAIGNPDALLGTSFAHDVNEMVKKF